MAAHNAECLFTPVFSPSHAASICSYNCCSCIAVLCSENSSADITTPFIAEDDGEGEEIGAFIALPFIAFHTEDGNFDQCAVLAITTGVLLLLTLFLSTTII
uniref:Uncharacterized protein n=1 Tax=Lygus hesperus TaxID=30085 RepID=A0A146LHA9_LYGHE